MNQYHMLLGIGGYHCHVARLVLQVYAFWQYALDQHVEPTDKSVQLMVNMPLWRALLICRRFHPQTGPAPRLWNR